MAKDFFDLKPADEVFIRKIGKYAYIMEKLVEADEKGIILSASIKTTEGVFAPEDIKYDTE